MARLQSLSDIALPHLTANQYIGQSRDELEKITQESRSGRRVAWLSEVDCHWLISGLRDVFKARKLIDLAGVGMQRLDHRLEHFGIGGDDVAGLENMVAALDIGDHAAGLLDQQ